MAKKKRKSPRKRATNREQVKQQIRRYDRLLDRALTDATRAMARVKKYEQKVRYYNQRLQTLQQIREEKILRSIDLNDLDD